MKEINGKTYTEGVSHDFNELLEIIKVLRSPVGCEWDRAQTFSSMKECLKNECGEVISAINNGDYDNLCEELGDVLLQVLLNARIAEEEGLFTFNDVVNGLAEKLIRRHPHVFGDAARPKTPEESLAMWRSVKEKEKKLKALKAQNKNQVK